MTMLKKQKFISPQRAMPTNEKNASSAVTTITNEVAQFYYYNAGVRTIDAGQAAGVVVEAKLKYNNIKNQAGTMEATVQDTSLSFTSTAFTTQKNFDNLKFEMMDESAPGSRAAGICADLANGEYIVDATNGILYGKKATNQTTLTAVTYKIGSASSSSSSGASAGSGFAMSGNGYIAKPAGSAGLDATTTYAAATQILVSGLSFAFSKNDIAYIKQIPTSGDATNYTDAADFAVSGSIGAQTITVTGAAFAATDTFEVGITGTPRGWNGTSWDFSETNPAYTWYNSNPSLIKVTNLAVDTQLYEYVDLRGKKHFAVQVIMSSGVTDDDIEVSFAGSLETDVAIASATYTSMNSDVTGSSSNISNVGGAVSLVYFADTAMIAPYFRVGYKRVAGAANDGDVTVRLYSFY